MSDPNIPRSERKRIGYIGWAPACDAGLGMVDTLDERNVRYCAPCQTLKYTCPETGEVVQEERICPRRGYYIDETKDQIFEEAAKEFLDLLTKGCEIQTVGLFYDAAKQIRETGRPWTIPDLKQFFSEASDKELNIKREAPEKIEAKVKKETPTTITRPVHYSCEAGKGDKVGLVEKQKSVTVPYVSGEDWEKLAARVEGEARKLETTVCGYGYKLVSATMELTPEEEKARVETMNQQPNPILQWGFFTQQALPKEFKK